MLYLESIMLGGILTVGVWITYKFIRHAIDTFLED